MQQLQAIWPGVVACGMPDLEGRARYARALTLAGLGRLDDAIIELEDRLASSPAVDSVDPRGDVPEPSLHGAR